MFKSKRRIPTPELVVWRPKNPGINWPKMKKEEEISKKKWLESGFPVFELPNKITGPVNVEVWEAKIAELSGKESPGLIRIMKEVGQQLASGAGEFSWN